MKKIGPDDPLPLTLSERERQIIREETVAGPELTARFDGAPRRGTAMTVDFSLDELDALLRCVLAEIEPCDDPALRQELITLSRRVQRTIDDYETSQSDE